MAGEDTVVALEGVVNRFGRHTVHDGVSFTLQRGTLVALIGGSGTGKSVLLRSIVGLQRPTAGRVTLLDTDLWRATPAEAAAARRRFGMMFQDGALFSSLTVAQNVAVPMREHTSLSPATVDALVALRLAQAGLAPRDGARLPSELSGGMRKRAALARALALEPELLFLDEPTAGLDPDRSDSFVALIRNLHRELKLTVVMVTHDLDTLFELTTSVAVLADQKVIAVGPVRDVIAIPHPFIKAFFLGDRAQRAIEVIREYPFVV